jgi:hypothetical protein
MRRNIFSCLKLVCTPCGGEDVGGAPDCVHPEGNIAEVVPSPLEAASEE